MNTTLSKEQIQARLGMFTGSEIHKLMGAKGLGKTGETYVIEKASEILTGEQAKPEFTFQATDWGIEHEPEAITYFEAATGLKISESDTLTNGVISGTPDGIINNEFLFEIKCPYNSTNHVKNLLMENGIDFLKTRPEYFWQMQAYFWLTGLKKGKFCSYDPRFKESKRMFILNIEADELSIDLMKKRVTEANLMRDNLILKLK